MRFFCLAVATGALAVGFGATDAYAGALKVNCSGTTPPVTVGGTPPCYVATSGSTTTQVDPGPGPNGPTTGGNGAIQNPDSTFTGDGDVNHGIGPVFRDFGGGSASPGPDQTVGEFLGASGDTTNAGLTFSNPPVADDLATDAVFQFSGTFTFTDGFEIEIGTNAGGAADPAEILLFVNGIDVLDTTLDQTDPATACNDVVTAGQNQNTTATEVADSTGAEFCSYTFTQAAGAGTDNYVLDYYSGVDAPFVEASVDVNGTVTTLQDTGTVPEPFSLSLFGAALLGMGLVGRRKRA